MLRINRKYKVCISYIDKFVVKKDCVWVYKKGGYPRILKTDYSFYQLRLKLTNLGYSIKDFKVEKI